MTSVSLVDAANSALHHVNTDPLFTVIKNRPMPSFETARRTVYPFATMAVGHCFLAGKDSKALKGRLYTAIHARKKKSPTEKYDFELMDNGDLYVWQVQA